MAKKSTFLTKYGMAQFEFFSLFAIAGNDYRF